MLLFKALSLLLTAIVAVAAFRHLQALWETLAASRVRAEARPKAGQRPATRLRQDPRTGVYYPED